MKSHPSAIMPTAILSKPLAWRLAARLTLQDGALAGIYHVVSPSITQTIFPLHVSVTKQLTIILGRQRIRRRPQWFCLLWLLLYAKKKIASGSGRPATPRTTRWCRWRRRRKLPAQKTENNNTHTYTHTPRVCKFSFRFFTSDKCLGLSLTNLIQIKITWCKVKKKRLSWPTYERR